MSNGNSTCPYTIMGVSRSATIAQVKTRYFELARKHHPDKLAPNTSDEEKKKHEEIFKDITNAYTRINKEKEFENKYGASSSTSGSSSYSSDNFFNVSGESNSEDWRSVWAGLEALFNAPDTWERMKNIVTDTIKDTLYEATMYSMHRDMGRNHYRNMGKDQQNNTDTSKQSNKSSESKKQHYIYVDVTMEEVHLKTQKKLRLFLKGISDPIFITLDIGTYPETTMTHTIHLPNNVTKNVLINFVMDMLPHTQYRLDDMFDAWDLWLIDPIKITWADYLCGKTVNINYIDGTQLSVVIEPFKIQNPYCIIDKGLCELGNLYIDVVLEPPKQVHKNTWLNLDNKFKTCFLRELEKLYK